MKEVRVQSFCFLMFCCHLVEWIVIEPIHSHMNCTEIRDSQFDYRHFVTDQTKHSEEIVCLLLFQNPTKTALMFEKITTHLIVIHLPVPDWKYSSSLRRCHTFTTDQSHQRIHRLQCLIRNKSRWTTEQLEVSPWRQEDVGLSDVVRSKVMVAVKQVRKREELLLTFESRLRSNV